MTDLMAILLNTGYLTSLLIVAVMLTLAAFQPSLVAMIADVIAKSADWVVGVMRAHAAARYAARAAYKSVYRHYRP